jgi:hypothetical protein
MSTEININKELAIAELRPIAIDIATFNDTLDSIEIETEDDQATVGDLVKFMNGSRKKLEKKRLSLVEPLKTVAKDIDAMFKVPRDQIDLVLVKAKGKMNIFAQAQHAIAAARAKAKREEAEREEREARKLAAELALISEHAAPMAEQVIEQAEAKVVKAAAPVQVEAVKSDLSTTAVNKTWTVEVLDVVALCRAVADGAIGPEMIDPNMAALRDFCRAEAVEREKFGCRFYQKISTTVR